MRWLCFRQYRGARAVGWSREGELSQKGGLWLMYTSWLPVPRRKTWKKIIA